MKVGGTIFTVSRLMFLLAVIIFVIAAFNVPVALGTIQLVPLGLAFMAAGVLLA